MMTVPSATALWEPSATSTLNLSSTVQHPIHRKFTQIVDGERLLGGTIQ